MIDCLILLHPQNIVLQMLPERLELLATTTKKALNSNFYWADFKLYSHGGKRIEMAGMF